MKIAVVISTFPPHLGGMGAVAFKEAEELAARGHQVSVFTLKYPRTDYLNDQIYNFNIKRLWPFLKIGDAGVVPQLAWQLDDFDVVHFHYPFYGAILSTLFVHIFKKKNLVVTYHMEAQSRGFKKFLQKFCDWIGARVFLNAAQKILVVSEHAVANSKILKTVVSQNPNKIKILPNGVDLENFYPWPEEMEKIKPQGDKVLLFVGNLLPVKRLDLILQVLKNLKDTRLLVVGGGYDFKNYQNLAQKLGVKNRVSFEGRISDPRILNNYYNLADAIIVPSDYESFSLVALEALSSGAPLVVSSGVGLNKEISAANVGEVFEAGNPLDLQNKIEKLWSDSKIKDFSKVENRRAFAKAYSWSKHLDSLEQVLKTIAGK